ncbi:MAG: DEAD/DEAH box helicase family protein [Candidatus Paceibacterota bacterium]|jgi:type III restriction enzyme
MSEEKKLPPQKIIIQKIRERVDAWRGFQLQNAKVPYPKEPPRYKAVMPFEKEISETTDTLLRHWFRSFPHELKDKNEQIFRFKYWPHQRRAIETFIYLYEVCGIRRREDISKIIDFEIVPQRDPWTKLGGQLATGSGKTKIMSLMIAWNYLNAVIEGEKYLGLGKHHVLIAPNLFVLDRLLEDFAPSDDRPDVFHGDPVLPKELERYWNLKVYSPETVPMVIPPEEGALVVTNIHKFYRTSENYESEEEQNLSKDLSIFSLSMPKKLENQKRRLIDSFKESSNIFLINDEAHHVHDEEKHKEFEAKAKNLIEAGVSDENITEELGWIRSIRNLNSLYGVGLQLDLSATLFEEKGSHKNKKGDMEEIRFRWMDLFKHTVELYSLGEAKQDGIIKIPKLEKVKVYEGDEAKGLINEEKLCAWEKYENLLRTGIKRWQENQALFDKEGDKRKQILFIICNNRIEAQQIHNYLVYGEIDDEGKDLSKSGLPEKGFYDEETKQTLFLKNGKSTVVQIHIGEKELNNEKEWEKIRKLVHLIDKESIEAPGLKGEIIENPYNVIVAVLMLKEGWDVRNVKTIIPLRPCDSRTLAEQTLGRGLRKMHQPIMDDDGAVNPKQENLYIIEHPSFKAIIDEIEDIVDQVDTETIEPPVYTVINPLPDSEERKKRNVKMLKFLGLIETEKSWHDNFNEKDLPELPNRFQWIKKTDKIKVITEFEKDPDLEKGLQFEFEKSESYFGLDRLIISGYVKPILNELRMSYSDKLRVLDVVKRFLEKRVFDLAPGTILKLDSVDEKTDQIVKRNIFNEKIMPLIKQELIRFINNLRSKENPSAEKLELRESRSIEPYQVVYENALEKPEKSGFDKQCMQNQTELRVAQLIDGAEDVTGWVYNDLKGVGYNIEYLWHSFYARYFPDFIARVKEGDKFINYIIEVKGRMDDKDKVKKERAEKYVELLTGSDLDKEEWRYLFIREDNEAGNNDISWWENRSVNRVGDLFQYKLGLFRKK